MQYEFDQLIGFGLQTLYSIFHHFHHNIWESGILALQVTEKAQFNRLGRNAIVAAAFNYDDSII
jgi:hypothetical protein